MLYRFGCTCGRYWWDDERTPMSCRKCRAIVYPREDQRSNTSDQRMLNGAEFEALEVDSGGLHVEEEVWRPAPQKTPPLRNPTKVSGKVHLELKSVRAGVLLKWFIALTAVGILNEFLNSDVVEFLLALAWLSWTWNLIGVVVRMNVGGGWNLGEFDWLDDWVNGQLSDRHEKRDSKPNHILQGYLDQRYDVDEYDTRMGASMGVVKDQERLRLLKELKR